ncbi:hypothetical protein MCOR27_010012 [Pyricularia oryzae]|uniref:Peptidase A1 domain-containing protein n=5 Tax=Pyricularia TaxID=48558 RepID=G5EHD1_PYRO7|nr:uncharacterized protein MGG_03014 [Pyricularia oryzae 70-15]ELQ41520.1 acid protease [Pyricularia oryzae Y34]KAH8838580.1 hypothetical protein MCOR01_010012 [Pyricularia oryzae]KAI6292705.1 hypothetical protein MCOR33_009653 [Pyricularia grisea]EAQ71392.1 hypothetical protein MGCH7_ch7g799 [Pyricularia oryzae 70-15]EHA45932.1 hypothetical protein MGG_03014 [Pyricularia oryzae 70-15]
MRLLGALLIAPAAVSATISFELMRSTTDSPHPHLGKRSTFVESIANNVTGGGYYLDVKIGTPGQDARMILDTGSSDAWVVSTRADLCGNARLQRQYGDSCGATYNESKSSTYSLKERNGFQIRYLDGSAARGDYIKDDFTIGKTTIKGLQMGVASTTVRGTGILGVGFSSHVTAKEKYPNIIDELVAQKIIQTKAYSLWLNDRRSPSGRILFGGIDTAKFIGALKVIPLIPDVTTKNITSFTVALSGFDIELSNKTKTKIDLRSDSNPALLDSGTTLTYLPAAMADKVFAMFGAVEDKNVTGLAYVSCEYLQKEKDMVMSFTFARGGGTIKVPGYEMILDVVRNLDGFQTPKGLPFKDVCLFGIQSTGQFAQQYNSLEGADFTLLGDTFLRSAYVVYDLDHNQVGIAQANLNATESKIVNLTSSDNGLPRLTGVASQVVNIAVQTTVTGADGLPTVTTTEVPAASESKNAAAGLVVGLGREVASLVGAWTLFAVFGGVFFVL